MREGESYTTVEPNADVPGGRDLVLYRTETGGSEVLVSAARLVPLGASSPVSIEDGYKNGSPITFTRNLKGNLLIVHGTGDDNVHYQSFDMLVNELIANGQQFTMMSYPNQSHGISEGRGTTMHLYNLLTSYLKTNLPPGGR